MTQTDDEGNEIIPISGGRPDFVVNAPKRKNFKIKLVGEDYTIHPPKGFTMMQQAEKYAAGELGPIEEFEFVKVWIEKAFDEEDIDAIYDRLEDEEDALDVMHIQELIKAVQEKATKNPTT